MKAIIAGCGLSGITSAILLKEKGYDVEIFDTRHHIGGNCYTRDQGGIQVHEYGPHIFHTSNEKVWKWINQYVEFNDFNLRPVANYKGEIYSLPFSMWTFSKLWGISLPSEAKAKIEEQSKHIKEPKNLEEQAIKLVGKDVYEKLIKGYTTKQWKKSPKKLPKEIIKRLPVRFTYENNYFNDKYQGIPKGGYTQIFEQLLEGIDLILETDYFEDELPEHENVIYTGPIDRFFDYKFGELEYKTTSFEHHTLEGTKNYQGTAMMNFTDVKVPYTRIIEHKHFDDADTYHTVITYEYPQDYKAGESEPYYPVNDPTNNTKYLKYKEEADKLDNVFFGGRLAEYKYYDMHQVIESALTFIKNIKI